MKTVLAILFMSALANAGASPFKLDLSSALSDGIAQQESLAADQFRRPSAVKKALKFEKMNQLPIISKTADPTPDYGKIQLKRVDTLRDVEREVIGL